MKKVLAINGGPRKTWNTATLLEEALRGAEAAGAEAELLHLYDLTYRGCVSCFACKRKVGYDAGKCAMRDDLSPVLTRATEADVLIMGSPIYLSDVTGMMRAFWERLVFSNIAYDEAHRSVHEGRIDCGVIYTMNVTAGMADTFGYRTVFEAPLYFLKAAFNGRAEYVASTDTLQFDDYSAFHAPAFDEGHKRTVRENQFPQDRQRAYDMGFRLAAEK